jgi:hypothetical protein
VGFSLIAGAAQELLRKCSSKNQEKTNQQFDCHNPSSTHAILTNGFSFPNLGN